MYGVYVLFQLCPAHKEPEIYYLWKVSNLSYLGG